MAKWGEGDPRWLVEDREDGKNVGQWHWEEINKMEWAKSRLTELLVGFQAADASITVLKDVSGEASVMTRKGGKRVSDFDLKLVMTWEHSSSDDDNNNEIRGEIRIHEFACTNESDEYNYEVTVEGPTPEIKDTYRQVWLEAKQPIIDRLETFTREFQSL